MKGIVTVVDKAAGTDGEPAFFDPESIGPVNKVIGFFKRFGLLIFLSALLLSGLVLGALNTAGSGEEALTAADRFMLPSLDPDSGCTPASVFGGSFSVSFVFAAALFFLALTPSGLPAIPALIFYRGYEYGVLSGVLCADGLSGIGFFLSVILAGAFLSSLALIYFSQYCLSSSLTMLLAVFGRADSGALLRDRFRELVTNGAYATIIITFASLTDTVLWFIIARR